MNVPQWYHRCGFDMKVEAFDQKNRILVLKGEGAFLKISPFDLHCGEEGEAWRLEWKIFHGPVECVKGCVVLWLGRLRSAFGLVTKRQIEPYHNTVFTQQFGADSGIQGAWVRKENYLNIPCAGTGFTGDPNISIYLSKEIKKTVKKLLLC